MQKANALLLKANSDTLPKGIIGDLLRVARRPLESSYKTANYH
jgi:hypothetical protein